MFNFTTTLSYGLRFMLNLAGADIQPKPLKKVAKEEDISLPYLRKLTHILEKAGLIKSLKGPGGGFILTRKPSQISVLEVVNILSKDRIRHCIKDPSRCARYDVCLAKDLWNEVYQKTQRVFENKTLETVINKKLRK